MLAISFGSLYTCWCSEAKRSSYQVLFVWRRMEANYSFVEPTEPRGFMDEEDEEVGSASSLFSGDEEDESSNSDDCSFGEEEELREDANSSSSSLCPCPASTASSTNDTALEEGPLFEMSSLMLILPFKRGLSKHYDGKSQSFASLSDVTCLEDLAKPERPLKKLRLSQSCPGGFLDIRKPLTPAVSSKAIAKNAPRCSFSPSLRSRRHRLFPSRLTVPLQRSVIRPSAHHPMFS